MKISYKVAYVSRKDDIHIDSVMVIFYEGDTTTENEKDINGKVTPVTRYRLLNKLREKVYTDKDFGVIKEENDLFVFLNKELTKDRTRTPAVGQDTLDKNKVK